MTRSGVCVHFWTALSARATSRTGKTPTPTYTRQRGRASECPRRCRVAKTRMRASSHSRRHLPRRGPSHACRVKYEGSPGGRERRGRQSRHPVKASIGVGLQAIPARIRARMSRRPRRSWYALRHTGTMRFCCALRCFVVCATCIYVHIRVSRLGPVRQAEEELPNMYAAWVPDWATSEEKPSAPAPERYREQRSNVSERSMAYSPSN